MKKTILLLLCLLIPVTAFSQWHLTQSKDGHWISARSKQGDHRIIVAHSDGQTHFFLAVHYSEPTSSNFAKIHIYVDRGDGFDTTMKRVEKNASGILFRIHMSDEQKATLLKQFRAGLTLGIVMENQAGKKITLKFPLLGFTAKWNDLLIANEIGRLDPNWLLEREKYNELFCLSAAGFSVQATNMRNQGLSYKETLQRIDRTGIQAIDDSILDIVEQVYALPPEKLPLGARGDKYGIFKRCMEGVGQKNH